MTPGFAFHPEARAEFVADVDWYDDHEQGCGERFEKAVRSAIEDALASPEAWPPWPGWLGEPIVRSRRVAGFPYRVVYLLLNDELTVVAVAHEKRRPGYWRRRAII